MKVLLEKGDIKDVEADVLLVSYLEDEGVNGGAIADIDTALEGLISKTVKADGFKGGHGATLTFRTRGAIKATRVIVVGLGKKKELSIERIRQAVGNGMRRSMRTRAETIALTLFGAGQGELNVKDVAMAVSESSLLSTYSFDTWKKKDPDVKELEKVTIIELKQGKIKRAEEGMAIGITMATGAIKARELVNEIAHEVTPKMLKETAERIAKLSKNVTVDVFNRAELKKMGMNAFLAVARGSDEQPYFIHLRYTPKKATKKSVALVGKGVTYDSGGLSLKGSDSMKTMKIDMSGAASVLGVFEVIDQIAPDVEVHGLIAACENMPSGKAYRPGDIVRAKNGLSIEVDNTDAEGRVTMADSLSYAVELKPSAIIDIATLTGACVVALGEEIVGLMSNNEKLTQKLMGASVESGEEMWEMPLFKGYNKLIESKVADVKNVGGRWGGALTAGLFLQKFVAKVPWIHLDIAGPAYAERKYLSYIPFGGTGVPVRTLLHFLKKFK
jgi:leucyl aminopeptidase